LQVRTIRVVGALFRDGGRFLMTQRRLDDRSHPGAWEFPGGKVEPGEDDEAALARELEEELGVDVRVGRQFCRVQQPLGPERAIDFRVYECAVRSGVLRAIEVAELRWLTLEEALRLPTPPADVPVLLRLASESGSPPAP
jgi:8-oxo-dGTP diphosphatase